MPVDPAIYADHEGFHLFYTTFFCRTDRGYGYSWDPVNPVACDITNTITAIGYAFSADSGSAWDFRVTPVIAPADSGFDAHRVETATIFRLGNTLYLAYSADGDRNGQRFNGRYQIGISRLELGGQSVHQTLKDESRRFERRDTPLLPLDPRPGRFDNNVQEPSIVVRPGGIELYYLGLGLGLPDQPVDAAGQKILSIGLGRAVLDERLNVISRSASALIPWVNMPEVRYFDGAYHLFATTPGVGGTHQSGAIAHSTSSDGVTWSTPTVIVKPGTVAGFDDWGLMAPTVAVQPPRAFLFYTAFGTRPGTCKSAGTDGRYGIPLTQFSKCMYVTVGRAVAASPVSGANSSRR